MLDVIKEIIMPAFSLWFGFFGVWWLSAEIYAYMDRRKERKNNKRG